MSVDKRLLEILVCPATKVPVKVLPKDKLKLLNKQINTGSLTYVGGEAVDAPIAEGLITEDGRMIYRVDDGIPVMLEDQGIATNQIEGFQTPP